MTEGRVYLCSWSKIGDHYRVWWKKRPSVAAEAETFEDADEELSYAICDATGDGESQHEYDPPAPLPEGVEPSAHDLVMIGGSESIYVQNWEEMFEGGTCTECGQARGARTEAPLVIVGTQLKGTPKNMGYVRGRVKHGPLLRFASADFRALLTAEEDAAFEWRAVVGPPRGRKQLFELTGARVTIPLVAPLGADVSGFHCEACGYESRPLVDRHRARRESWYVAATDLPSPLPSVFATGHGTLFTLLMPRERWRAMREHKGANGCAADDLGVLADSEVDRVLRRPTWRDGLARVAAGKVNTG